MGFSKFKLRFCGRATGTPPTPPADITATFLSKTRAGSGGVPSEAASGSVITGTGNSDFAISSVSDVVPAGTYNAVATYSLSSYALGLASGQSAALSVSAGGAHVTALASDTSGVSQLRNILGLTTAQTGALTLGDTVIGRDCHQNPAGANDFIGVPTGLWAAGSGSRITVTSENPASGTDANGYPIRGGGFKLGKFYLGGPTSEYPLDFADVSFYINNSAAGSYGLGAFQASGSGVGFYRCDFRYGPDVTSTSIVGMSMRGPMVFEDCHFENMNSYGVLTTGTGGLTLRGCIFYRMIGDAVQINGGSHSITDNFISFFTPIEGVTHGDCCQLGTPAADVTAWGEYAYNGHARGPNTEVIEGGQGLFGGDPATVGPKSISDMNVHHNLFALDSQNVISLNTILNSTVQYNTLISDPCSTWTIVGASIVCGVSGRPATGWTNCTISDNIVNAINSTQTTDCTIDGNLAFAVNNGTINDPGPRADYLAALTVAFPNMWQTAEAAPKNMRELTLALTPGDTLQSSGGVMRVDGTCPGALFPPNPGEQWGSWNDGSVYDPGNPTWVAAHPPVYT